MNSRNNMSEVPKKSIILPLEKYKGQQTRKESIMRHFKRFVVVIALALFSFTTSAQTMELGLFGGGSYYIGEMNTALHFSQTQLAYGVLARFNLNSRWAIKAGYNRGTVKGR